MNFIGNAKGLAKNPLGIIALFVSLIYGFACLVLGISISNFKDSTERLPLIWFVILFPVVILGAFVFLVTTHHGKLYSPSDYGDTEAFLKTLGANRFEPVQIDSAKNINNSNTIISSVSLVAKAEGANLNQGTFSPATKENLIMANRFHRLFIEEINKKKYRKAFYQLSFGAQAPEYFILGCGFSKKYLSRKTALRRVEIIIRITRDDKGILNMIGIGKGIVEIDVNLFAERILEYIDKFAQEQLIDWNAIMNDNEEVVRGEA